MPHGMPLIGVTATLLAGEETTAFLQTLNLTPGSFFFQHRSNTHPDVQDIYRILHHGLSSWSFPDLDWIIESKHKTIIYCDTFALSFCLRVYFYYKAPHKVICLYNSLCFPSYNSDTLCLFLEDRNTQIIIAMDALVVGIDLPNVKDIVDLDCKHPNHGKQCKGRAGRPRGDIQEPKCITYVTKATMDKARKMVAEWPSRDGEKWVEQGLHIGMAQMLVASCHPACDDVLYDNPQSEVLCMCNSDRCRAHREAGTIKLPCRCSGSVPEPPLPRISAGQQLSKKMHTSGMTRLQAFRQEI